jgi:cell division protein FtsQ
MARRESPTILQEELYPATAETAPDGFLRGESARASRRREYASGPAPDSHAREYLDDARLVDLDVDEESPFLRAQKRVSARRNSLPKKTANIMLWATVAAAIVAAFALIGTGLYEYGERSWRFRVESSDNIEISGMENVTKAQIMEVMGADIGRNIFFVPLAQQKAQLEQIPWVESASVMRFVPNRLRVEIHERTPLAFARVGPKIELIDAGGTLMDLPKADAAHGRKFSFPVILGMNPGEPLSTRAPRMKTYRELIADLDSGGARYSQDLSEVDLSDLEDVRVRVNDPAGDVLLHLGSSDYLKRYRIYVSHEREWRQQFQKLESVNLRYDNQVIVNPDMEAAPKQAQLAVAAARAAVAAGVKPAALVTHVGPTERPVPKPVFELSQKMLEAAAPSRKTDAKKVEAKGAGAKKVDTKKVEPRIADAKKAAAKTKPRVKSRAKKVVAKKKPASTAAAPASAASAKPSPAVAKPSAGTSQN